MAKGLAMNKPLHDLTQEDLVNAINADNASDGSNPITSVQFFEKQPHNDGGMNVILHHTETYNDKRWGTISDKFKSLVSIREDGDAWMMVRGFESGRPDYPQGNNGGSPLAIPFGINFYGSLLRAGYRLPALEVGNGR